MNPENILEVKNLMTHFRTENGIVRAVDGITFDLRKGETLGIVGESGSGKSVTSLSIMNLLPRPAGKIHHGSIHFRSPSLGETDLVKLSPAEMSNLRGNEISMIFQEPMTSLNPVFTCGDQVMEAILRHQHFSDISNMQNFSDKAVSTLFKILPVPVIQPGFRISRYRNYTRREKRAMQITLDLFRQTDLPNPERIFESYPHQLSGGQKQRVMIAMAMSCNPSILIADEPTTALDVTVQKTILDLMKKLRDEKQMSILFITHDLGVIAEIADFVLVMYRGKIVEFGPVDQIFRAPRHPYTKGLLACRPRLDKKMKVLPTVSDFMRQDSLGKMVEIEPTMESVLRSAEVTDEEYTARQKKLASQEPILSVKNLKTWFHSGGGKVVKAVDDVSFDVFPGETMGLVGESGCGKTTLGRTILRLEEPTAGQVLFKGKDLAALSEWEMREVRKDLQIIFQDPYSSLNPRMTVGNAIFEPMKVHGLFNSDSERLDRVHQLLERVHLLPEHFHRYPHEFSGGQRQRVCIARALALNPKFIICDESVSALDVSVQASVLNLLIELRNEFDFTYIFISHDLNVVKFISDRMIVMNKGKIEEMGNAEEIYRNPASEYTRALISSIPRGELSEIEKNAAVRRLARQNISV